MNFETMQATARATLLEARGLGFDHLVLNVRRTQEVGIRLAQSAVCRENVHRENVAIAMTGTWQERTSTVEQDPASGEDLLRTVRRLRQDLEAQSQDREFVAPCTPPGNFTWAPTKERLAGLFAPDILYPLLEKHVARVRDKGWRVTGYVEASEIEAHAFTLAGTEFQTRDTGITMSFTVDDGDAKVTGATHRGATHPSRDELDRLIGEALSEALEIAETSRNPQEFAPGDYTVVLHPSAVLDILSTMMAYSLFDQRKVDEKRTYLSGKVNELRFPQGLRLSQTLNLPLGDGRVYADAPFNHRFVPCESVNLIDDGRIRDLHVTPFWARELGSRETFGPGSAPPLFLEAAKGSPLQGRHRTVRDLIADTRHGLFVANLWYLRMVAEMDGVLTGMTRDGLYEIRDGKLVRPIKHMRWHDNPFRMLGEITGITDEKLLFGRSRLAGRGRAPMALMPALRVENFHFSSVTKF